MNWIKRERGKLSNGPNLANLPQATETFQENMLRPWPQDLIWNACSQPKSPSMNKKVY